MINRKVSAIASLVICFISAAVLIVWLFSFPQFFELFYIRYHHLSAENEAVRHVASIVVPTFYACAPFAAAALYLLIRLLFNIIREKVFIIRNVWYLRIIAACCFAVCAVTLTAGLRYAPLLIITFAAALLGTLLRVVKNVMHAAVELREENDLTI